MALKSKLPIFPGSEIDIGNDTWVTIGHLKSYILRNHNDIANQYCIRKRFNKKTGSIDRQYAWHSIFDAMNATNVSEQIINRLYGYREEAQ